ncbi:hypothetical protein [Desulforhabdus sp. TSK]|uniref:hypothetical protein n=1 Tax=Desulforhabdus sp. TSK TaxID=2925014 RepID=UPI001FC836FC|nr:hypothetical protein [Desulforhabdus sp. TSK]GKT07167.1 hypothetical protein DSTSK_04720 [Desulforhabdus sp. TSK]
MGIFSRRKYIGTEQFPKVVNTLAASFESLREEYILGSLMQLKREGADVSKLSRDIAPGSELEDLLKGFQLTCMIGIAWDYIKDARDQLNFDKMLSSHLGAQEGSRPWNYREKYVDCQGHIEALSRTLAADVHRAFGHPEPREKFLVQFYGGAHVLIGLCQEAACIACGDHDRARDIRRATMRYVG